MCFYVWALLDLDLRSDHYTGQFSVRKTDSGNQYISNHISGQKLWRYQTQLMFLGFVGPIFRLYSPSNTTQQGNNFVGDGHVCNTFCPVLLKLVNILLKTLPKALRTQAGFSSWPTLYFLLYLKANNWIKFGLRLWALLGPEMGCINFLGQLLT